MYGNLVNDPYDLIQYRVISGLKRICNLRMFKKVTAPS